MQISKAERSSYSPLHDLNNIYGIPLNWLTCKVLKTEEKMYGLDIGYDYNLYDNVLVYLIIK